MTINVSDGSSTVSKALSVNVSNVNEANASYWYLKTGANASANLNPSNDPAIDYLMSGYFWGTAGSGIDLNYSFMESNSTYSTYYSRYNSLEKSTAQDASAAFKSAVAYSLAEYSNVSLLSFNQINEVNNQVGHIRLGTTSNNGASFAWYPYPNYSIAGDTWFNSRNNYFNNDLALMKGSYWHATILHEIGHTLGLAHPFEKVVMGHYLWG